MKKKRKTLSLREKEESQNKNIATDTRNCFYCDRFKACKEIGKSWKFVCPRFKKLPDINFTELKKEADESVKKEKPKKGFNIIVGKDREKPKDKHNPKPKDLLDPDGFNFITEALDAVNKFNKSPLPSDYEIDDSDAPLAKNVFEFMTSPEFLGFPSFSRQIQMGAELFSEICPLCSNPKWVERGFPLKGVLCDEEGNPDFDRIKRNVVFLEFGRCTKCSSSKMGLIKKGLLNPYVEFCGVIGQRAGKSEISRQWLLYTLHRFLKLQKPAITYGLGPTSKLTFTLMAQTFAKAKRDLYDPVYATLTSCPWFVKYHEILSYYSEKSGVELFRVKDTFASYRLSNIDLLPETPDTRNLRGATRAGGILDELDWIDSNDGTKKNTSGVRTNVEEIYVSVSRSFATIRMAYERMIKTRKTDKIIDRNILPPPMLLGVSSPSSTKSIMMKNLALSQTSRILYGAHMPTWEVNPDLPKNSETIQLEFKRNFDRAMRDFGAQPPHSANPFIRDIETMQAVVSPYRNLVKSKPKYITSNSGTVMLSAKIKFMQPKDNINRIMAIDAGESFNSFVIGTGFYDEEENEIICDSIVEIIPEPDIKINFNAVCANVIGDMIERLNVSFLVADRWQSAKLLSDFEDIFGIYTQTYSLKYNDMSAVRVDVYDGHFKLPKCEVPLEQVEDLALDDYPFGFQSKPVAHLLHQFITVRDFGKEVTKGIGFTDDIFRMFCLLHKFIADPEYREFCSGVRIGETKQITPILGVVGSRFQGPGIKAAAGGGSGMITSSDGAPIGVSASRRKQAGF